MSVESTDHVLASLERSGYGRKADEALRVSYSEMNGSPYLQLRIWYLDPEAGEWRPTKRGLSVRLGEGPAVIAALQEGLARAKGSAPPVRRDSASASRPVSPRAGRLPVADPDLPRATYSADPAVMEQL